MLPSSPPGAGNPRLDFLLMALFWAAFLALIQQRSTFPTFHWLGVLTCGSASILMARRNDPFIDVAVAAGAVPVGELLRALVSLFINAGSNSDTAPGSPADVQVSARAIPLMLQFTDAKLEDDFATGLFRSSLVPTVAFFCSFVFMIIATDVSAGFSTHWFAATRALALGVGVTVRIYLSNMDDQQYARLMFGRMVALLQVTVGFPLTFNTVFRIGVVHRMTVANFITLVCVGSLRYVYYRLASVHRAFQLIILCQSCYFHLICPATTALGHQLEALLGITCTILGDLLGWVVERHLRASYLRRRSAEPRLADTIATGTDESTQGAGVEASSTKVQAQASKDRGTARNAGGSISPISLRFTNDRHEDEYTTRQFKSVFLQILMLSGPLAILLSIHNILSPSRHALLHAVAYGFMFATWAYFHTIEDVQRARLLYSRTAVTVTLLSCVLFPSPGNDKEMSIWSFCTLRLIYCLLIMCIRFTALHVEHRLLMLTFTMARVLVAPTLTSMSRQGELLIGVSGIIISEIVGYTIEGVHRREWLDLHILGRQLHLTETDLLRAERATKDARAEVEAVAERAHHDMAAYLFHEIRNDINAIVGVFDYLVEEDCVREPSVQLLHDGQAHAHHTAAVVANVLNWSKLQANKLTLPADQPFELATLGEECRRLVKSMLRDKPVTMTVVAPQTVGLQGSPVHLKQTLLNLLTNACKYTERGTVCLSMTVLGAADSKRGAVGDDSVTVRFAVEDTGVGVSPQDETLIFEEFTQGPRVGTGLGLPLTRALVALMGGELRLERPAAGQGSIFTFACCFQRSVATRPLRAPSSTNLPAGLRVLVADDLILNRKMVMRLLSKVLPEPEFTQAATAEEARAALFGGEFALATLDEHFESDELVGTEITRLYRVHEQSRLASAASAGRPLPLVSPTVIIGLTGMETEAHRLKAIAMGQSFVWGKPMPAVDKVRAELNQLLVASMQLSNCPTGTAPKWKTE
jgi:signal transduction histidine kinase